MRPRRGWAAIPGLPGFATRLRGLGDTAGHGAPAHATPPAGAVGASAWRWMNSDTRRRPAQEALSAAPEGGRRRDPGSSLRRRARSAARDINSTGGLCDTAQEPADRRANCAVRSKESVFCERELDAKRTLSRRGLRTAVGRSAPMPAWPTGLPAAAIAVHDEGAVRDASLDAYGSARIEATDPDARFVSAGVRYRASPVHLADRPR